MSFFGFGLFDPFSEGDSLDPVHLEIWLEVIHAQARFPAVGTFRVQTLVLRAMAWR